MRFLVLSVLFCVPTWTRAQDAQQRRAAADAYDRGSAAFLAEDYTTAARWFETAHNLAPAPSALLQAARAHRAAGSEARAATLALQLSETFEGAAAHEGSVLVDELSPSFGRVDVSCGGCAIQVDGTLVPHTSFFVSPGEEHELALGFSTGDVQRTVSLAAGETTLVEAEAPPAPEPVTPDVGSSPSRDPGPVRTETESSGGGLSPALFATSLVATLGAGGVLIWSGIDTQNDADAYELAVQEGRLDEAQRLLDDGQGKETRTNALIGVTAGLGVLTVVFAILTDWDGDDDSDVAARPMLGTDGESGMMGVQGAF